MDGSYNLDAVGYLNQTPNQGSAKLVRHIHSNEINRGLTLTNQLNEWMPPYMHLFVGTNRGCNFLRS